MTQTATLTGLAGMKQAKKDHDDAVAAAQQPKAPWFKFDEETGDTQVVQFLQELDESATGYDPVKGLAHYAHEHVSPVNFKKRAGCTVETEGRCAPDEWHKAANASGDPDYEGGWRPKVNFYITVAVKNKAGKWESQILSRNFYSSFVEDLMEIAEDESTITDRKYTIKRSGAKTTTRWSLKEVKGAAGKPEDLDVETFDLKTVAVRNIPYDEQSKFFERSASVVTEERPQSSAEETW